jgi:ABC-type transport system involved in multi-copper enzyme maturation permease subunit
MSHAATAPTAATRSAHTPTIGSLLGAELLRIRSRRFVRWTLAAVLGLIVLITVVQIANLDEASQGDLSNEAFAAGLLSAIVGFVLGATFGGAEWSQKTMPALLFWEPRRVRVFLVKIAALLIAVTVIMALIVTAWFVAWEIVVLAVGNAEPGENLDPGLVLENLARCWVLVLTLSAIAFGIASLTRNTGAALGVGFVYFIAEQFIGFFLNWTVPWLLLSNVAALLTEGGYTTEVGDPVAISAARGGVVLAAYAVVVCGVGLELFRRRDVT